MAEKIDKKSFRDLDKIYNDLIDLAAELNEKSDYYIIGHGFDKNGKEMVYLLQFQKVQMKVLLCSKQKNLLIMLPKYL